jgi:hypothetical protein
MFRLVLRQNDDVRGVQKVPGPSHLDVLDFSQGS